MFGFIAAMAAAAQAPAAQPAYLPDMRCMVAMAIVLGAQDDASDSADGAEEDKDGLIGLVMYYVGKIEAKAPDLDYLSEVNAILQSADYMAKQFPADAERCAAEAADKGHKLEEIGQALSGAGRAAAGHQH